MLCRAAPSAALVSRLKAARPTLPEMHDAGVMLVSGGPSTLVDRCPFRDDHAPSLWFYPHSGVWSCNHPDWGAVGVYDVINFRALTKWISNCVAITQLADEFL